MNNNKTILVVEDDKLVFDMINAVVEPYGQVIHERAVDGAIGALNEYGSFDLLIVDLKIVAQGLTSTQMVEYRDMEGYAFLKEFYWKGAKDEQEKEHLMGKTIICSRYKSTFEKKYPTEAKQLTLVSKDTGFVGKLQTQIKKIFDE